MPNTPQPLPVERSLLTCPFCGGKPEYHGHQVTEGMDVYCVAIACEECAVSGRMCRTSQEAEDAWNIRAAMQPRDARALEVVKALVRAVDAYSAAYITAERTRGRINTTAEAAKDLGDANQFARQYINEMKG